MLKYYFHTYLLNKDINKKINKNQEKIKKY